MRVIQPLLLLSLVGSLTCYFVFFRSRLRDRITVSVLFLMAMVAVAVPEVAQWAAERLGVGRGVDLVFYLFGVTGIFVFVLLYSKIEQQSRMLTELVRYLAVRDAKGVIVGLPADTSLVGYGPVGYDRINAERENPSADQDDLC